MRTKTRDKVHEHLIIYADLIDNTEVAVEQTPFFYTSTYLASFQWTILSAYEYLIKDVWRHGSEKDNVNLKTKINKEKFSFRGDEIASFASLKGLTETQKEDLVGSAVLFSYIIKLYWYLSPYNLLRMYARQFPRDIAVGIHIGPASECPPVWNRQYLAGLHLNIGKRIETLAREGKGSRIYASEDAVEKYLKWCKRIQGISGDDIKHSVPLTYTKFDRQDRHSFKGVSKSLTLYELEWKLEDDGLQNMMFQLDPFDDKKMEAENVLKKIAKEFFSLKKEGKIKYSLYEYVKFEIDGKKYNNHNSYIMEWLDVVSEQPIIFFDEEFLATSIYIIACALIHYSDHSHKKKKQFSSKILKYYEKYLNKYKNPNNNHNN